MCYLLKLSVDNYSNSFLRSAPPPPPMRRSVSTRQPSRAGPSRVSSMIVHDIDEEEKDENSTQSEDIKEETPAPAPSATPVPRTRKAKELQTRLGVGKPQLAGGQGPRAVTRSSGSSKGRGLKASRSIKPMEATIEEGWYYCFFGQTQRCLCIMYFHQNRK